MENNNKPVVHLISKPDNMLKTYTQQQEPAIVQIHRSIFMKARMMKKKCSN